MKGPFDMELTVKSIAQARLIGKILASYDTGAAARYLEKAELRREIEKAARDNLYLAVVN